MTLKPALRVRQGRKYRITWTEHRLEVMLADARSVKLLCECVQSGADDRTGMSALERAVLQNVVAIRRIGH